MLTWEPFLFLRSKYLRGSLVVPPEQRLTVGADPGRRLSMAERAWLPGPTQTPGCFLGLCRCGEHCSHPDYLENSATSSDS